MMLLDVFKVVCMGVLFLLGLGVIGLYGKQVQIPCFLFGVVFSFLILGAISYDTLSEATGSDFIIDVSICEPKCSFKLKE